MNNNLTIKQKKFCELYFSSGNIKESYIQAYDCNSDKTASVEGTKLLKNDKIIEYLKTLNKPIIDNIQQNKQNQINFIKDRIEYCISNNDENNVVKYTDQLNKIYGVYKDNNEVTNNKSDLFKCIDSTQLHNLLN